MIEHATISANFKIFFEEEHTWITLLKESSHVDEMTKELKFSIFSSCSLIRCSLSSRPFLSSCSSSSSFSFSNSYCRKYSEYQQDANIKNGLSLLILYNSQPSVSHCVDAESLVLKPQIEIPKKSVTY